MCVLNINIVNAVTGEMLLLVNKQNVFLYSNGTIIEGRSDHSNPQWLMFRIHAVWYRVELQILFERTGIEMEL
jgi:hypothetical protein